MPDNYPEVNACEPGLTFQARDKAYEVEQEARDRRYFFAEMLREGLRLGYTPRESIELAKDAVEAYKAV